MGSIRKFSTLSLQEYFYTCSKKKKIILKLTRMFPEIINLDCVVYLARYKGLYQDEGLWQTTLFCPAIQRCVSEVHIHGLRTSGLYKSLGILYSSLYRRWPHNLERESDFSRTQDKVRERAKTKSLSLGEVIFGRYNLRMDLYLEYMRKQNKTKNLLEIKEKKTN